MLYEVITVLPGQLAGICTINSSTSCYAPGANAACAASRNPFSYNFV